MNKPKVVIVPGNYETDVHTENWYDWTKKKLEEKGFSVFAENMPDAKLARKEYWLPFIEKELKTDQETIFIGHSSGAVAGMRYAETHKIKGLILVGACYTDLGDETEKTSGYYEGPWLWKKIKDNTEWIVQFSGQDDPYIPIAEARIIHEKLSCEYHEYTDRGHFGSPNRPETNFQELVDAIVRKTSQ